MSRPRSVALSAHAFPAKVRRCRSGAMPTPSSESLSFRPRIVSVGDAATARATAPPPGTGCLTIICVSGSRMDSGRGRTWISVALSASPSPRATSVAASSSATAPQSSYALMVRPRASATFSTQPSTCFSVSPISASSASNASRCDSDNFAINVSESPGAKRTWDAAGTPVASSSLALRSPSVAVRATATTHLAEGSPFKANSKRGGPAGSGAAGSGAAAARPRSGFDT
mmetsp:Transcript_35282/g.119470  ORF Transcript_35282/g.119470 Transcript_35282/m.119470 type:complete len:229 (-) Transcript_35282:1467-2153(-)